jgi:hypothetical protein
MCEHSFVPTITISYSFMGFTNGAWLVSNTHSSRLINISSSTKREQHFDGPVDVCKSSNKRTRTWMERGEEILAQKTKYNFRLSAQHAHLPFFVIWALKTLIRTWMTWHDANLSSLWPCFFIRTKDSLFHWATDARGTAFERTGDGMVTVTGQKR